MPGSINCIDNKTTDSTFFVENTDVSTNTSNLDMRKSRAGAIINSGDTVGNVRFMGFDGSAYQVGARIFGITNGTIAAGRLPTELFFSTAPDSVSSDLLRMTIATTGEVTIAAPDSGIGLTIAGGGEQITAGDLNVVAGNILLADTNAGGTQGIIELGGNRWLHNFGTSNTFVGEFAGSLSITFGTDNVGVGTDALSSLTSGSNNIAVGADAGKNLLSADASVLVGFQAGENITTGVNNVALGYQALQTCVTNINNVALGYQTLHVCVSDNNTGLGIQCLTNLTTGLRNLAAGAASLPNIVTGSDNIAFGFQAAQNYTGAESNNIIIGNNGVLGDANTIRIGTQGSGLRQQNTCFIAGISGVSVSNLALVSIDTVTGQLGSTSGGSSFLNALNGDSGTATPSGGAITIAGGTGISTSATASTVTINLSTPVSIAHGGTNATSFVTTDGTIYYDGTRLVTTTTGTAGQVLTSNGAGVAPTYQSTTPGTTTFDGDSGSATPSAGVITMAGGHNITTAASGSTVTFNVSGTTNHAVQVGNATNSLTSIATGSSGQLLQSAGASADPAWTTSTYPSTNAQGDLIYGSASNVFSTLAKNTTATRYLANTGTSNNPQWDQVNLTNGVTGVLPIANGGTNASSFATTDGTVYYDGTRLVTTATGTSGQVLTSNGAGVAPTYQAVPSTTLTFDADSGSATPSSNIITFSGAGTVSTSASGSTVTITGSASVFPWTVVTGASASMAVNNGYIANNGGTCVLTLPATAAVGSIIRVTGINNNTGWKIAQNSGQIIHFGDSDTTTGATGFLASSLTRDSVELVCVITNTDWNVLSVQGNVQVN
jgi:hypothetical protein